MENNYKHIKENDVLCIEKYKQKDLMNSCYYDAKVSLRKNKHAATLPDFQSTFSKDLDPELP